MATKADNPGATTSERVADSAHEAIDRLTQSAAQAEERIRTAAAQAEHDLRDKGGQAQHRSEELAGEVGDYVNEHPLTALGVAFAAGMLISSILRR